MANEVKINLFIDTCVYLGFYDLRNDDFDVLRQFTEEIGNTITLYVPEIQINEFDRRREELIGNMISRLKKNEFNKSFEYVSRQYPEYESIINKIEEVNSNLNELVNKIEKDAIERKLTADIIINNIFSKAEKCLENDEIIKKAILRRDKMLPPGKKQSINDRIIWESLIANIKNKDKTIIVSYDNDYISPINSNTIKQYLYNEWKSIKNSEIIYFNSISSFGANYLPTLQIIIEEQKEKYICNLASATNYKQTHFVIEHLNGYSSFSNEQCRRIIENGINNTQIHGIQSDTDVNNFYLILYLRYIDDIDEELEKNFLEKFPSVLQP